MCKRDRDIGDQAHCDTVEKPEYRHPSYAPFLEIRRVKAVRGVKLRAVYAVSYTHLGSIGTVRTETAPDSSISAIVAVFTELRSDTEYIIGVPQ